MTRLAFEARDSNWNRSVAEWDVEEIATVTGIDIAPVQLSELEMQFREALKTHITRAARMCGRDRKRIHGGGTRAASCGPDGNVRRWRMRPLVQVQASVWTEPDFLLSRSDAQDLDVAVYLDGRKSHASPENNRTADDAVKRDGCEETANVSGRSHGTMFKPSPPTKMKAGAPDLVHQQVQNTASEVVQDVRLKTLWQNPIDILIEYVSHPQAEVWPQGAFATVIGLVNPPGKHGTQPPVQTQATDLTKALRSCLAGTLPASDPKGAVSSSPEPDETV
ncbi:hypothetical protein [Mycobacterium bourgelatii]|uniref:Uncharacterized protein n=1 Tax=Mycobacterium bourgelatii TaxID=1273442 RepID=A0A7I9YRW5_MYCBU|nr:hypothetical protein [Mycobacterium bourgelatii]MCV6978607.1 hypothetical protein [Mycobacterium bourgelatii]GFG91430.1 hypothetical protein MBOU_34720 [Mycobacterium bourgelatii]